MNFSNPAFYALAIIGLVFVILGIIMQKYPPKKINHFYGYRTKNSMKSQERWNFAQQHSAKGLLVSGVMLIVLAAIGLFINENLVIGIVYITLPIILTIIILVVRTERALREKFKTD